MPSLELVFFCLAADGIIRWKLVGCGCLKFVFYLNANRANVNKGNKDATIYCNLNFVLECHVKMLQLNFVQIPL